MKLKDSSDPRLEIFCGVTISPPEYYLSLKDGWTDHENEGNVKQSM